MPTFQNFYLKVELVDPNAKLPARANHDDAGADVYSPIECEIQPGENKVIELGWRCEFPKDYAMIYKEKSGVAVKKQLSLHAGVVDAGYRGIHTVVLFNRSNTPVKIEKGEKIAQFMIVPVWHGHIKQVDSIDVTNSTRGEGGFGSTGKF